MDLKLVLCICLIYSAKDSKALIQNNPEICDCAELRNMVLELNKTVGNIYQKHQPIGFSVALSATTHLGDKQTVEFNKIVTNIGNAYEPSHGHFTAPLKGLYHFSVTATDVGGGDYLYLQMVKNGAEIARVYTGIDDSPDVGATSVVVALEQNDMVWIRSMPGRPTQTVDGGLWTTFSGFLLQTM